MSINKFLTFLLCSLFIVNATSYAQLVADFDANEVAICPNTTVRFTDRSSGGPTSWSWKFNSPNPNPSSTLQNPSFIYTTPGTYSVTLTVYKGTSSATVTKSAYITVYALPTINFTATPTIGCPPLSVAFTNTSSYATGPKTPTFMWYLGPGATPSTSTSKDPNAVYTSGPNNVTLTVTDGHGCSNTLTKNNFINVHTLPGVNFSANVTDFCSSPGTAIFTANPSGNGPFTYDWKFGDGGTGTGSPSSHSYTFPPNSYSPKLIVTDVNGCKDSLIRNNYINVHFPVANFTAPSSACEGTPVQFNNTSTPAGGTCSWSFGSAASNPYYTFTAGTFNVTLTYTYRGCVSTVTKSITIHPKPVADFTKNPDTLCPAPAAVQFTPNGTYANYWWDFGVTPQVTSTSASPTYVYPKNGFFSPTLVVTTGFGCKDTITKFDYVKIYNMFLDIIAIPSQGCKPLTVNFSKSLITTTPDSQPHAYPYPVKTYTWNFGDGTGISNLASPTHTYVDTGVFTVTLTIVTQGGNCVKTATTQIKVGQKPIANFTAAPQHICFGKPVQFTDLSTGPINEWKWAFGDGNTATSQHPVYTYSTTPGVFDVTLFVKHNGCADSIKKTLYITVDSPKAMAKKIPSCDTPTKIKFINQSVGATSITWLFGDPLNSTATTDTAVFIYPGNGSYTAKIASYNFRSGCRDTFSMLVNIITPTLNITANDTAVCRKDTITFTASIAGKVPKMWLWYVDTNTVTFQYSSFVSPVFQWAFNTTGRHHIRVVVVDEDGCNHSLMKSNYVIVSQPDIQFTATPKIGCVPLNVGFSDNTTVPTGVNIIQRYWRYGTSVIDTGIISGTSHNKLYSSPGIFDVKLIVTDDLGCKDSILKTGYIQANKPDAVFTAPDTACPTDSVAFLDFSNSIGPIKSYSWDFGDTKTSTLQNPKHLYGAPGSYTVRLIVTDTLNCLDTATAVIAIVKPNPSFDMDDSVAVCPPLYVKFTNTTTGGGTSYSWDLGNGNSSTFTSPKQLYTAPGIYKVVLRATDAYGCVDSITRNVRIYGFNGAFSYAPLEGCIPLTVTFNAVVTNVANMEWDFSDGNVVKQLTNTITHTYTSPGAFVPKLVVSDASGCKALSMGADTIKPDAVIADFTANAPCENTLVTLMDTSTWYWSKPSIWKWKFHDGTTSTNRNPTFFYGPAGTYPIKFYVETNKGCKDSITKDLLVHPPPVIDAGADSVICLKDSMQLTAKGGKSYIWDTTPYLSCLFCPDPYAKPAVKFQFFVLGIDEFNCKNRDSVWVDIKTKVVAIASPDGEICQKESINLQVKGGKTYVWSPTDGLSNASSAFPVANPLSTLRYRVISFEGSCIPDTDFVKITVHPLPTVAATGSATIIAGNSTNIQATGSLIHRFKWEPAESLSCSDCPDPTAKPNKTTEYTIKVYTDHNCVDSDKVTIKVLCDKSQIFLPNTFTPNGDGQNDVFYPRGVGLSNVRSFRIFNRWGEMVFEAQNITLNDESKAWDGQFRGAILPPDVYVYTLDAICDQGDVMTIKGDITLVR